MTRTVLITGGTGGLGRETARVLADAGWRVVITGRDARQAADRAAELSATGQDREAEGQDGAAELSGTSQDRTPELSGTSQDRTPELSGTSQDRTPELSGTSQDGAAQDHAATVVGRPLDLGDLADVRRFAAEITASEKELCAVICNAGTQTVSGTTRTKDGYEETFGVNHLAHFLLVQELLEHLSEPARIVFVASDTHDPARPTGMPAPVYTTARDLALPGKGGGRRAYTTSKLCNVLTTYELARRLGDSKDTRKITVNAFDPGLMPGTGLARDYGRVQALAWRYVLPALTVVPGLNAHTPRQSARALARLITDEELEHITGRYFSGHRELRSSKDSYDLAKASDLWNTSVELTSN
jgi:NAD(P)-dependent dehydrogenase (short-subunit alcohol dehydrogenase family)